MATGNWHIRTVYGPRRQGKLLIVCIWWDSDTKQWVVIECTLPHLLGWAQFTLFRDTGLHPEEYDLFTTILGQSATTPHDAIKEHQVYPEEHGWKHLKSRLHEVDIVFGIGCRALGYDVTTLANGSLKLMKPDSQIVLTRQKGRLPSDVTCPLDLIEEAGTVRHALDFDDLDQTDQERARFFYDLNLRFLESGDLGALLSDPDTSPARCVIFRVIRPE